MSKQTRLESLLEATVNVAIGFCISYAAWPLVAWAADIEYSHAQNLGITAFFTVLSISRSYIVRRWFAADLHKWVHNLAMRIRDER